MSLNGYLRTLASGLASRNGKLAAAYLSLRDGHVDTVAAVRDSRACLSAPRRAAGS